MAIHVADCEQQEHWGFQRELRVSVVGRGCGRTGLWKDWAELALEAELWYV